jgi:formylglycine-generating enzyme required for sulfatase activity/tRNA A-37 threonylcarbamoyl transferase component Bud32
MTRHIGKYEIVEEIGRGGFATVYRARDRDLDREVAIKVLDPLLMRDPSLVARFRREARAAARLQHPNIVRIYDISQVEGVLAIVMELLPGPSLAEVIEAAVPLYVERAVELLRPLAEALDYAHAQGVKPSNVLLDGQGQPMLTDFGLVKAAEESGSSMVSLTLSQTGMTLGTPAYMAPEQADPDAEQAVDHRADLYSLGVIAYEMLAGGVPFEGKTPLAVAMGHVMKQPPPPRALNPALPESCEAVLLKMLAKDAAARFPDAGTFVEALAGAEPASEEPATTSAPAATAKPLPLPPTTPAPRAERPRPSRRLPRWVWVLLVGGVAVAIVLGLVIGLRSCSQFNVPQAGATQNRQRDGMVMVYVPGGEFEMGSPQDVGEAAEHPQHTVTLDAFWIDKYEVSNAQYRGCVQDGACGAPMTCDWGEPTYEDASKSDHPVVCVPWYGAEAYCAWAGGRLPTEAEWEKTARGADIRTYPWGNPFDGLRLNYCDQHCEYDHRDAEVDDGYARTAPGGSYPPGASPYGALDMAGNVWEWVADWYDAGTYSRSAARNPTGPDSGGHRVLRGGSWDNTPDMTRSAFRLTGSPDYRSGTFGFRCVMSPASSP